jgi:hypothetical protein
VHGAAVGEGRERGAGLEQERQGESVRARAEARCEEKRGATLAGAEVAAEECTAQARGRAGDFVEQVTGEARRVRNEDVRGEVVLGVEAARAEEVGVEVRGGARGRDGCGGF